jgi:hypothetical protein
MNELWNNGTNGLRELGLRDDRTRVVLCEDGPTRLSDLQLSLTLPGMDVDVVRVPEAKLVETIYRFFNPFMGRPDVTAVLLSATGSRPRALNQLRMLRELPEMEDVPIFIVGPMPTDDVAAGWIGLGATAYMVDLQDEARYSGLFERGMTYLNEQAVVGAAA